MKPDKIINFHGHLRKSDDIPARVRIWEKWNVVKFCCSCMPKHHAKDYFLGNDEFLAIRDDYKDILVGFAGVNLSTHGIDSADTIRRYRDQGFAGLKFIDPCLPYNHETYYPLYEVAEELSMPILFHTGYLGHDPALNKPARTDSENMSPYKLDKLARAFPDLNIVGAHLGRPQESVALYLMEFFPNLFFDFSGGGGGQAHVRGILSAMLPHAGLETDMADPLQNRALKWFEQIVFGTDNPEPDRWVPASEQILDKLEIPQPLRDKFYYETAARILA